MISFRVTNVQPLALVSTTEILSQLSAALLGQLYSHVSCWTNVVSLLLSIVLLAIVNIYRLWFCYSSETNVYYLNNVIKLSHFINVKFGSNVCSFVSKWVIQWETRSSVRTDRSHIFCSSYYFCTLCVFYSEYSSRFSTFPVCLLLFFWLLLL